MIQNHKGTSSNVKQRTWHFDCSECGAKGRWGLPRYAEFWVGGSRFIEWLMRIKRSVFTVLFTFIAVAAAGAAERFPWLSDLGEARALAAAEGKPLLIVYRCEP